MAMKKSVAEDGVREVTPVQFFGTEKAHMDDPIRDFGPNPTKVEDAPEPEPATVEPVQTSAPVQPEPVAAPLPPGTVPVPETATMKAQEQKSADS